MLPVGSNLSFPLIATSRQSTKPSGCSLETLSHLIGCDSRWKSRVWFSLTKPRKTSKDFLNYISGPSTNRLTLKGNSIGNYRCRVNRNPATSVTRELTRIGGAKTSKRRANEL